VKRTAEQSSRETRAEMLGVDTYYAKDFVLTPHDIPRLELCPAARVFTMKRGKTTAAHFWGIGFHKFLEYAKTRGRGPALAYMQRKFPRMLNACARVDVDALPDGETEPAFIIDVLAGSCFVGHYLDAEPDQHFFAKGDLVFYRDGRWHVWDYKTGSGPATQESEQIRTLCTAVWLREGAQDEMVDGAIVIVTSNGDVTPRPHTFYAPELAAHSKRLRHLVLLTAETRAEYAEEGAAPEFIPGPHCHQCDIERVCPKRAGGGET
jgi:hypothetical protein